MCSSQFDLTDTCVPSTWLDWYLSPPQLDSADTYAPLNLTWLILVYPSTWLDWYLCTPQFDLNYELIFDFCLIISCSFPGDLMDFLALLNSSINFILYCTMSRQFRVTFSQIFLPKWFHKITKRFGNGSSQGFVEMDSNGRQIDTMHETQMTQL